MSDTARENTKRMKFACRLSIGENTYLIPADRAESVTGFLRRLCRDPFFPQLDNKFGSIKLCEPDGTIIYSDYQLGFLVTEGSELVGKIQFDENPSSFKDEHVVVIKNPDVWSIKVKKENDRFHHVLSFPQRPSFEQLRDAICTEMEIQQKEIVESIVRKGNEIVGPTSVASLASGEELTVYLKE